MAYVIAPLLINWVVVPTVMWLIAVGLFSGGVAGAARRWPELAWLSGTRPTWRAIRVGAIRVGATLLSCALIVGMALI